MCGLIGGTKNAGDCEVLRTAARLEESNGCMSFPMGQAITRDGLSQPALLDRLLRDATKVRRRGKGPMRVFLEERVV